MDAGCLHLKIFNWKQNFLCLFPEINWNAFQQMWCHCLRSCLELELRSSCEVIVWRNVMESLALKWVSEASIDVLIALCA